jgi:hypothetical protein
VLYTNLGLFHRRNTRKGSGYRLLTGAALLALIALPSGAFGGPTLVFDQYDPADARQNRGVSISGIESGLLQLTSADDFILADFVNLSHVVFWSLEENDPAAGPAVWDGTLEYAIWQDSGAMVPASTTPSDWIGSGQNVSRVKQETGITGQTGATFDQYQYSFDLESTVGLSGNTRYWLSIYLGQIDNATSALTLNWQQSDLDGFAGFYPVASAQPITTNNADNLPPANWGSPAAFYQSLSMQLYGTVPVPATTLLLLPFLGIGIWLRRGKQGRIAVPRA